MKKQLTDRLDLLIGVGKPKEVWAVYYKEHLIVFPSKKSSWATIGSAKNAVRNYLYPVGDWRTRLEEIKKLEYEGIIKYIKLL